LWPKAGCRLFNQFMYHRDKVVVSFVRFSCAATGPPIVLKYIVP
jgi:hypothetical protein